MIVDEGLLFWATLRHPVAYSLLCRNEDTISVSHRIVLCAVAL